MLSVSPQLCSLLLYNMPYSIGGCIVYLCSVLWAVCTGVLVYNVCPDMACPTTDTLLQKPTVFKPIRPNIRPEPKIKTLSQIYEQNLKNHPGSKPFEPHARAKMLVSVANHCNSQNSRPAAKMKLRWIWKEEKKRGRVQEIRLGGVQFLLRKSLGSLIWKAIVAGVNHPRPKNQKMTTKGNLFGCKKLAITSTQHLLYKNRKF